MDKQQKHKIAQHDPQYNDPLVVKFINHLMKDGKKSIARKSLYHCFEIIKKETKKDPLKTFHKAIQNVSPYLEIISRRIGGAHYQIPKRVHGERRETLAMRWLLEATRNKKGAVAKNLAREIISASKKEGEAIKKRRNTHRMAEANKAFAYLAR